MRRSVRFALSVVAAVVMAASLLGLPVVAVPVVGVSSPAGATALSYEDEVVADGPAAYLRLGEVEGTLAKSRLGLLNDSLYEGTVTLGGDSALLYRTPTRRSRWAPPER